MSLGSELELDYYQTHILAEQKEKERKSRKKDKRLILGRDESLADEGSDNNV